MRRSWLLAPLLLAFAGGVHADDWSRADTARQAAVTALLVADWGQTRWIARHNGKTQPDNFPPSAGETNPFLGRYPTTGKVNNYFAASIISHAAISYLLPSGAWRQGWQYTGIIVEISVVLHNRSVGIRMEF